MSYKALKRHGRTLNPYYQVKEGYIVYDFNPKTFWEKKNYGNNKKVSGSFIFIYVIFHIY